MSRTCTHRRVIGPEVAERFDADGYVVVRGWLNPQEDLAPVVREYEQLLEHLAERLLAAGKLSRPYRGMPFTERLMRIFAEAAPAYDQ
ncbi:MAG: hypothetical protein VB875_14115, partial [Pirellulales bacterium]